MRGILVDWLIQVHHKMALQPETLYLTIYIMDRFLSVTVSCACMCVHGGVAIARGGGVRLSGIYKHFRQGWKV